MKQTFGRRARKLALTATLAGLLPLAAQAQQAVGYPVAYPAAAYSAGTPMPTGWLPWAGFPGTGNAFMPVLTNNPWLQYSQPAFWVAMQPRPANTKPYTMHRMITQDEKRQMMQTMLPAVTGIMNMNMAEAMNYFAFKYKAKEGLSFDDVRDSLLLRANQVNMKKVGENLMWKDFQAVLSDNEAPRIEVYSFCDIAVGRELLKISPEFAVFLPCRVAIMEDADKAIWVMMLDWNPEWVEGYKDRLQISDELWKGAVDIRQRLDSMMQAAANGDL